MTTQRINRRRWTISRLEALKEQYRAEYWPRSRRLATYRVVTQDEDGAFGWIDYDQKILVVNVNAHKSDRDVRATLLHEMVHCVVGRGGHGTPFWAQLEYLLKAGAPITVGFPELGEMGDWIDIIPRRFVRCRRLFRPAYKARQKEIAKMFARLSTTTITPADMATECYDMALDGLKWRAIWAHQCRTWGFEDMDGRLWLTRGSTATKRAKATAEGADFFSMMRDIAPALSPSSRQNARGRIRTAIATGCRMEQ